MVNRRSEKLDALLGEAVTVMFFDGTEKEGILEYGQPKFHGLPESNLYSVYEISGLRCFFRKSHVKDIRLFQ